MISVGKTRAAVFRIYNQNQVSKTMTDADIQMAKLPHPFVNGDKLASMDGQLVAIVGKVDRIESGSFILRTTDGKDNLRLL